MGHRLMSAVRRHAARQPVIEAVRHPTPCERTAMHDALDRFVEDERALREQHRTVHCGTLYAPEIEAHIEACIAGQPIDPEVMWRTMDALDQYHRLAVAAPRHFAQERRTMRALMQGAANEPPAAASV
jgi:hypothetical protein